MLLDNDLYISQKTFNTPQFPNMKSFPHFCRYFIIAILAILFYHDAQWTSDDDVLLSNFQLKEH
jgi:hypothetical protein